VTIASLCSLFWCYWIILGWKRFIYPF